MWFDFVCIIGVFITMNILCSSKGHIIPQVSTHLFYSLIVIAICAIYFAPEGADKIVYKTIYLFPDLWMENKDSGWIIYNSIIRAIVGKNANLFFLINAIIYTFLFVYFVRQSFQYKYWFYFFLLLIISLGYYSGGTNIMRSGLATAILYCGMTRYDKPYLFLILMAIASSIHLSISITIGALIIGYYYPKLKIFTIIWIVAVALSFTDSLSGVLSNTIDFLGSNSYRLEQYTSSIGKESELYTKIGWRLDFVLYSAYPLLFAYYYKAKIKFSNRFYDAVISAYLIANSFWLCVIRMPFTDRIALLSWVLIPIICLYPPLKNPGMKNGAKLIALSYIPPITLKIMYLIPKLI